MRKRAACKDRSETFELQSVKAATISVSSIAEIYSGNEQKTGENHKKLTFHIS